MERLRGWTCLAFIVCGMQATIVATAEAAEITLRLAHVIAANHSVNQAFLRMAEILATKTNGRVELQVFPGGQLGNEREVIEALKIGSIDLTATGPGVPSGFEPKMGILTLPYLFNSFEVATKALASPAWEEINQAYIKSTGVRMISFYNLGFRNVTTRAKAGKSLEEIKGLKIRTVESPYFVRTLRLMGLTPTPIPWGEVYTSLQTGVVDGLEHTPEIIYSHKLYEVAKHIFLTRHILDILILQMSEAVHKRMPPDVRKAIREAGDEARAYHVATMMSEDNYLRQLQDKGMTITAIDLAPLRAVVTPVYKELDDKTKVGPTIERLRSFN